MSNLNKYDEQLNKLKNQIEFKIRDIQNAHTYANITISKLQKEEKEWMDRINSKNLELAELSKTRNELINNFNKIKHEFI